jgi:flavodoxin
MKENVNDPGDPLPMKSILMVFSYHHHNTEKIAKVIAKVLDASVKTPQEIRPDELQEYDLVGFGSGIYSAKLHESLFQMVNELPQVTDKKAFLFSTAGITGKTKSSNDHSLLREKLQSKGFTIVDEFQCKGFNTNSFLKLFGGINKGRPNAKDLQHAEEFAQKMKQNTSDS